MTAMPPFDENNIHSIEFEAPLSADPTSSAAARRHFSIDLSLELERQLDMEAYPPTPAHNAGSHSRQNSSTENSGAVKYESLDPHVLAHIVQQLRQSLSDMTKDRDELLQLLASAHSHEAELKDALQHMTDKATTMEVELSDARSKIKDDEDAISMLRAKVEESRRGLMRLQTESRRQSMAPVTLDLSRAGLPAFGSPPSSKRASFSPLTGTLTASRPNVGHRRISSTDTGTGVPELSTSPNTQATPLPESAPPVSSRRYSGLFGRTSPPQSDPGYVDILSAEIQGLRKEMQAMREELDNTKHELLESNEAREASETCVTALREFIAENNIGARQVTGPSSFTLPPPPIKTNEEESGGKPAGAAAGWGFKLWKDATVRTPVAPQSATVPSPTVAPSPQVPQPATPLSRKIGGFFSSHKSASSIASSMNIPPPTTLPQLQTNAAASVRDSMYSFSDASSMAEPISPPNEFDGNIIVRDVTNISELRSLSSTPDVGKGMQAEQDPRHGVVVA
ncbi:hypothetical protein BDZ94DRAFT_1299811 [Collybia nuda]|uniref:Uncharacterized protein n=1 Tax=Collybia nuda TaxID=64659 RepID=A0A9P5Y1B2_9AGAR|nr:hypothetical protein BDZ94DRAFT_1299811 [Collybia nuda]